MGLKENEQNVERKEEREKRVNDGKERLGKERLGKRKNGFDGEKLNLYI